MFENCDKLSSVSLFDTSNVTDMSVMFDGCLKLSSVPLFDTSNVTNMEGMLAETNITSLPLFDTRKVTNMASMLDGCDELSSVPLFDTRNVSSFTYFCRFCYDLTAVPLLNTDKAIWCEGMFYKTPNVVSGALALYKQMSSQYMPLRNHNDTFGGCGINTQTGSAELAQIPADWK